MLAQLDREATLEEIERLQKLEVLAVADPDEKEEALTGDTVESGREDVELLPESAGHPTQMKHNSVQHQQASP